QEAAEAPLMTRYTGGKVQSRSATLAINMRGGGGFEIWQYTSRSTEPPRFTPTLGDFGIYICKLHCSNVAKAHKMHREAGVKVLTDVQADPAGTPHYLIEDPFGNLFQVIETTFQFGSTETPFGGVYGAIIGVSDMEKSLKFYNNVLGFTTIVYDHASVADLEIVPGTANARFRRVCLTRNEAFKGPFSPLLGSACIEL
ncbi:hypothetical protein RZS08_18995, partial [Arthrospira platensis SPKY1]|nr:hypothetical protein [Arthrospira platensis SPKY1]